MFKNIIKISTLRGDYISNNINKVFIIAEAGVSHFGSLAKAKRLVDLAKNSVVGYRGFGAKKENLIPWSNAFIKETQKKNIIATAKHFPGHGDTSVDSHINLPIIKKTMDEIRSFELVPFTKAIEEDKLPWPQLSNLDSWEGEVFQAYGISSTPSNILIDKKGVIVAKNVEVEDLENTISKYLN